MSVFSVEAVMEALHAQPPKSAGAGRCIMVIGAQPRQGVTTAARAIAEAASANTAYAIDLDLRRNALAHSFGEQLGAQLSSVLGGMNFYAPVDAQKRLLRKAPPSYFYHRVGQSHIFVGVFDQSAVASDCRIWISDRADYWDAARATGATMVIDAPALERSQVGLRVARHMDGVVLVVGTIAGAAPAALAAKSALQAAGANVIGLVYSGASAPVMAIDRLMRKSA